MKKVLVLVLALVMVMSMGTMAFASPAPKSIEGELTVLTQGTIYEGDTVQLQAKIMKHGSKFVEEIDDVELTDEGYYIINYSVVAGSAGTQSETYAMTMTAGNGKSFVVFNASASTIFEVVAKQSAVTHYAIYGSNEHKNCEEAKNKDTCYFGNVYEMYSEIKGNLVESDYEYLVNNGGNLKIQIYNELELIKVN